METPGWYDCAMRCCVASSEHCSLPGKQAVRDYAARIGADEAAALDAGMADKAAEFRESGGEVYREA